MAVGLVVAALSAGSPPALAAQAAGFLLGCTAASTLARGCTLLSVEADPASILAHPAALRRMTGRSLSVSGTALRPVLGFSNAVNTAARGEEKVFPLPSLYVVDRARGRFTIGLGAEPLGGFGTDYRLNHALYRDPATGAYLPQTYSSRLALLRAGVAAAWEPAPGVALGATAGVYYQRLEFKTPYSLSPASFAGLAGLAADPDYAPLLAGFTEATASAALTGLEGVTPAVGVSAEVRLSPRVVIAAATSFPATVPLGGGRAAMDLSMQFGVLYQALVAAKGGDTATVNAQLAGLGVDPAFGMATSYRASARFGIPRTATVALLLRPADRWSLSADGGWIGYRAATGELPLRLAGGTNPNINILVSGDPANGTFASSWPLRHRDSWVVRLGTEYAVTPAFGVRGGVMYGTDPVPSNTLIAIFPAIERWAAAGGVRWAAGRTEFHLAYSHTFTAHATGADPHLVAQEYRGSDASIAFDFLAVGATWRF